MPAAGRTERLILTEPFAAIAEAHAAGRPMGPRDVLRFEPAAVRILFDEGLIEQAPRRRGTVTDTIILPTALALTRPEERTSPGGARCDGDDDRDDGWPAEAIAYLEDAYPAGASFREMADRTGIAGGRILVKAHRLGLERPAARDLNANRRRKLRQSTREDNWMLTPAWRIRRLRMALRDARARGTNPHDDGEGLEHRALRRRFALGRAQADTAFRRWTPEEDALLREHYPAGGAAACRAAGLDRTPGAVFQRAQTIGIAVKGGGRRRKYEPSPEIDAAIRRVYVAGVGKGEVNALADRLGLPSWWCKKRAIHLGLVLPRTKELPWSEAEAEIVRDNAFRALPTIRRLLAEAGHRRTETAIKIQIKRRGFETADPDHLSATGLAKILGCDAKKVTAWIEKGWLAAGRRGTARTGRQGGDSHWIHKAAFAAFVFENPNLIDLRKVDQILFLDLLAGRVPGRRTDSPAPDATATGNPDADPPAMAAE